MLEPPRKLTQHEQKLANQLREKAPELQSLGFHLEVQAMTQGYIIIDQGDNTVWLGFNDVPELLAMHGDLLASWLSRRALPPDTIY